MSIPAFLWARLAPYNPKEGNVVRRHVYRSQLYLGGDNPHWYKVPTPLAYELSRFTQDPNDPRSPKLFQVFKEEDRRKVDEHEYRLRLAAIGATAAHQVVPFAPPVAIDRTAGGQGTPADGRSPGRAQAVPEAPTPMTPTGIGEVSQQPVAATAVAPEEGLHVAAPTPWSPPTGAILSGDVKTSE